MSGMSKELMDFLNAVGAIAETAGILRDRLMQNGFSRQEAVSICSSMISSIFQPQAKKNGND